MDEPLPRAGVSDSRSVASMTIRSMSKADLATVLAIENVSFSSPWTAAMFLAELQ